MNDKHEVDYDDIKAAREDLRLHQDRDAGCAHKHEDCVEDAEGNINITCRDCGDKSRITF